MYIMPKGIRNWVLKRQKLINRVVPPIKDTSVVFFPILISKSSNDFIFKSALYFKVNSQKKYFIAFLSFFQVHPGAP